MHKRIEIETARLVLVGAGNAQVGVTLSDYMLSIFNRQDSILPRDA